MGSIGGAELLDLLVIAVVSFLLLGPFVGMRRAVARQKRNERSTLGVVLASVALGLDLLFAATGMLNWWFLAFAGPLTLTWLYAAVQANKFAARKTAPLDD